MNLRTALALRFARPEIEAVRGQVEDAVAVIIARYNHDMLDASRHNRDIIAQFLIELDRPEDHDALRETLHQALVDLSDHVARLEEHVS